jgi:hypothetical protein
MTVVERVELWAEQVLAAVPPWIWDGESLPVPIEDIVDTQFGLLVRDVEEMGTAPGSPELRADQSLSGLLLASRGEIWVNATEAREWPPRRRFTIGHELGHWILHRADGESVFCRPNAIEPADQSAAEESKAEELEDLPPLLDRDRPPVPLQEHEANAFAAALLMPPRLIQAQYEGTGKDFDRLCALFGTSQAAMGRRLRAVI